MSPIFLVTLSGCDWIGVSPFKLGMRLGFLIALIFIPFLFSRKKRQLIY
jgi:hypothetical protein